MMKPKVPTLDSVTTINEDGSRYFIHPADVRGFWTRWRRVVGYLLLGVFILLPHIRVGGEPAVFLDLAGRKFHFFGGTLMFQDLWLLFFLITGLGFSLFFVTAIVGRVWCGWTCPQTVFLDHVVRRIERILEGDALSRRRLDEAPWTAAKLIRRGFKHLLFFGFAGLIAFTFVSYFVSAPRLWEMVQGSVQAHWGVFLLLMGMSIALYIDFAWFREQFCIVLCPYGRFQSALVDENTIVVGYDERRGEPRGKAGTVSGDCIDCRRCVQVCPTGIDIRQGLQMECIACEACIDACDEVMERLGRQKGLIRHDSLNRFAGRPWKFLRPRVYLYLFFAVLGGIAFSYAVTQVKPVTLYVTRMQGAPYIRDAGVIRNQFLVRVGNKRGDGEEYRVRVRSEVEGLEATGATTGGIVLKRGEEVVEPLILLIADENFRGNFEVEVEVLDGRGEVVQKKKVPFLGPYRSSKKQ